VAGIVKDEFPWGIFKTKRTVQVGDFPSNGTVIDSAVGVEGIVGSTQFLALARHYVDRIVEKRFGEGGCPGCHEDLGPKVGGCDQRKGSDMVMMGVGDKDRPKISGDLVQ
jgi:hypothetical protein